MKSFLLLLACLATTPALAQDYGVSVKHEAQPIRSFGAPVFGNPDSTSSPRLMLPGNASCYVTSRLGPWYRVSYGGEHSLWALVSTLYIPGSAGHETPQPCPDANALLITTPESVDQAWTTIQQVLLTQGYAIAQSQDALHSFYTTPKALGRTAQLTIAGVVQANPTGQGAQVLLSGGYSATKLVITGLGNSANNITPLSLTTPAVFRGGIGSLDRLAFSAIDQAAHAYPRGIVKYALR